MIDEQKGIFREELYFYIIQKVWFYQDIKANIGRGNFNTKEALRQNLSARFQLFDRDYENFKKNDFWKLALRGYTTQSWFSTKKQNIYTHFISLSFSIHTAARWKSFWSFQCLVFHAEAMQFTSLQERNSSVRKAHLNQLMLSSDYNIEESLALVYFEVEEE